MLEIHLPSPVTRERLRASPAADHIDEFAGWLHARGYRPATIDFVLRALAGWTDWMLAAGFTAQDLPSGLEACKAALKVEQHVPYQRGPNQQSLFRPRQCSFDSCAKRGSLHSRRRSPLPTGNKTLTSTLETWPCQSSDHGRRFYLRCRHRCC